MSRYNVVPVGAGSTRWRVERNGAPISRHNTQGNAIDAARGEATSGDTLVIHQRNGVIREQTAIR